jgi:hypothetical protein
LHTPGKAEVNITLSLGCVNVRKSGQAVALKTARSAIRLVLLEDSYKVYQPWNWKHPDGVSLGSMPLDFRLARAIRATLISEYALWLMGYTKIDRILRAVNLAHKEGIFVAKDIVRFVLKNDLMREGSDDMLVCTGCGAEVETGHIVACQEGMELCKSCYDSGAY